MTQIYIPYRYQNADCGLRPFADKLSKYSALKSLGFPMDCHIFSFTREVDDETLDSGVPLGFYPLYSDVKIK
jgi:hypothetical protein